MDSVSTPQLFYAGAFRHSLDDKHRLTIPARWRTGKAQEFIILPHPDQRILLVMPPEEFARMSTGIETNSALNPPDRRVFLRHFHAQAELGVADKQGRLVLPEARCRDLDLKGEVMLVGGRGRFEVWNVARWEQAQAAESSTYQHVANMLGI